MNPAPFILASGSPRRRELCASAGLSFRVVVSGADEDLPEGLRPEVLVETLAARKAEAVATLHPEEWVLGADTEVFLDGERLGKPATPAEARGMLEALSGREHEVLTGVALVRRASGTEARAHARTRVGFHALRPDRIAAYVEGGEPYDKAGGYGIQGAAREFVARIDGPWDNVVGLPLDVVRSLLDARARSS